MNWRFFEIIDGLFVFQQRKVLLEKFFQYKFYLKNSIKLTKTINFRLLGWRFFSSPAFPETRVFFFLAWFIFLLKISVKKNDQNTVKVIFNDVIGCSIGVYNFIILKSSLKTFYITNENKNKIRTFWGWKSSKNKKIEPHQNFIGSYKKMHNTA